MLCSHGSETQKLLQVGCVQKCRIAFPDLRSDNGLSFARSLHITLEPQTCPAAPLTNCQRKMQIFGPLRRRLGAPANSAWSTGSGGICEPFCRPRTSRCSLPSRWGWHSQQVSPAAELLTPPSQPQPQQTRPLSLRWFRSSTPRRHASGASSGAILCWLLHVQAGLHELRNQAVGEFSVAPGLFEPTAC